MKILMVHPHDIYLTSEPWTIRIKKIAEEFVKLGHAVKLVYFPLHQDRTFEQVEENRAAGYQTIAYERSRWHLWHNTIKMCRLARWADIVHFQKCFPYAALPSLFAARLCGKPVHYDWDDWEYQIYNHYPPSRVIGWYLNTLERRLPGVVDTISVASANLHQVCVRLGFDPQRIFDSHVGADLAEFSPQIDGRGIRKKFNIHGPIVIYLGQLHSGQYVDLYIEAARVLRDSEACFLIIGGGYDLQRCIQVAGDLVAIGKVIFTGFVGRHEVARYLAAADIAVACFEDNQLTRSKSPLKIAEYMAAGKAIVASKVGEVERMLGGAGLLVPPGDSRALADGIARLLNDRNLRAAMAGKARKRAEEKYNWQTPALNILQAYRLALSQAGTAAHGQPTGRKPAQYSKITGNSV